MILYRDVWTLATTLHSKTLTQVTSDRISFTKKFSLLPYGYNKTARKGGFIGEISTMFCWDFFGYNLLAA